LTLPSRCINEGIDEIYSISRTSERPSSDVKIKFGGGLHTSASADEIDQREAADGQNFLLDLDNRELRNRPPFDLIGTVPNGLRFAAAALC
jgi:hypothetical protein